jgi:carboxyl-terminal processing protease
MSAGRVRLYSFGLIVVLIGTAGCLPRPAVTPTAGETAENRLNLRLMTEAWGVIRKAYVNPSAVTSKELSYGAIEGMVDALGDTGHSRFLRPGRVKRERDLTEGKLEGIGAQVQIKNNRVVVVAPIDGSPADRAGLRPGDAILRVNGKTLSGLSLDQAIDLIVGPANSSVTLTILRPDTGRTIDMKIIRSRITLRNVTWLRLPGTRVAHVRIAAFSKGVTKDLGNALTDIDQERLSGIILDLRNNPGGLLDEAVGVASQFLASGTVVLQRNSEGKITPMGVRSGGRALTLPMVVLVNGGSASAAEIVAGALKDAKRAPLVGEKTFGTGTVLEVFHLSDGSALMLAVDEWLTPGGRAFWHEGIAPDIEIPLPSEISLLIPEKERELSEKEILSSGDLQLLRGLDILTRSTMEHSTFQEGVKGVVQSLP